MRFSVRWEIFIAEYNVKEDFFVGVFLFFIGFWDMIKFQTTVSFDAHTVLRTRSLYRFLMSFLCR